MTLRRGFPLGRARRRQDDLLDLVRRLEASVRAQARASKRIDRNTQALVRALYLDRLRPTSSDLELTAARFSIYSQNEEDGMVVAVLSRVEPEFHRCVELGCGQNGGSSGFLVGELGWEGLMIDGDGSKISDAQALFEGRRATVLREWISVETVNELLRAKGFDRDVDYVGIDLDGNDFWIWNALELRPRVIVAEYNSIFGPEAAVTIPYRPDFDRVTAKREGAPRGYFGASLGALVHLGRRLGYRLVAVEPRGVNAFFVRSDLAPELRGHEARALWRPLLKRTYTEIREMVGDDVAGWYAARGRPLVDVRELD